MNPRLAMLLLTATIYGYSAAAQDRRSVGMGSPPPSFEPTPQEIAYREHQTKTIVASNQPVRVVNGRASNIIQNDSWKVVEGIVDSQFNGILILQRTYNGAHSRTFVAVTNYSGAGVVDQGVTFVGQRVGVFNYETKPIELWDCGTPYVPPPLTPEQIQAAQESAKRKIFHDKQKSLESQSNAVVWLAPQATNGVASAQFSLAMHYLIGQGCATNRDLAIYWLKQSATQGNEEAAAKLTELKLR